MVLSHFGKVMAYGFDDQSYREQGSPLLEIKSLYGGEDVWIVSLGIVHICLVAVLAGITQYTPVTPKRTLITQIWVHLDQWSVRHFDRHSLNWPNQLLTEKTFKSQHSVCVPLGTWDILDVNMVNHCGSTLLVMELVFGVQQAYVMAFSTPSKYHLHGSSTLGQSFWGYTLWMTSYE